MSAVGGEEDRGEGVDDGRERRRALRQWARGGLLLELVELDRDLVIVLGLVGGAASAREESPPGAAKDTQVGPVPLLHGAAAAVEAEEGLTLLVGGGDDAVANLGLDGLGQDQRESGGGQEKVHGGERRVRRRRRRQVRGCVSL